MRPCGIGTSPGNVKGLDQGPAALRYAADMLNRSSETGDRRLIEAGMALASERELDVVLLRIVELAVDLTGARYGALGVLSPDGGSIQEFITVGITPEQRAALGIRPPATGSSAP